MSSKEQVYRHASLRVERHWLQGWYRNKQGDHCMTQAIIEALPYRTINRFLPEDYRLDLHNELWAYRSYRTSYAICELTGQPLQYAIEVWNDTPGRRRKTVVALLQKLADKHRTPTSRVQDTVRPQDTPAPRPVDWQQLETEQTAYRASCPRPTIRPV